MLTAHLNTGWEADIDMGDDTYTSVAIAGLAGLLGVAALAYATYSLVQHRAQVGAVATAKERAWVTEGRELLAEFLSLGALIGASMDRAQSDISEAERDALGHEVWPRIYRFMDVKGQLERQMDLREPVHRALIEALRRAVASAAAGGESFAAARRELTRHAQELFEAASGESRGAP